MGEDHFLKLQPGTIVNGSYEVVKCLGAGSMGMVYACRHRELSGRLVAMKVLFAEVAGDSVATARFRNEIFASYEVNHPNVVRAYEYFRDGDMIAFTMEYVGGGDLAERIGGLEPIPIPTIIKMLQQMCSGVQAIHDAGIIHRDLKPENILITSQGDIKITDFGIARTGTGPKLTEHGGVVGTIDYVSPEYLEIGQVDARSDIYALGVLAYEMVTGESPFKGQSVIETMTMRLRTDPEPPRSLRSECPKGLSDVILKAMTRDPERRYQSAAQMQRDLQMIASGQDPSHARDTAIRDERWSEGTSGAKGGVRPDVSWSSAEANAVAHKQLSPDPNPRTYSGAPQHAANRGYEAPHYSGSAPSWDRGVADPRSRDFRVQEERYSLDVAASAHSVGQYNPVGGQYSQGSAHPPYMQRPPLPRPAHAHLPVGKPQVKESRGMSIMFNILGWLLISLMGFGLGLYAVLNLFPSLFGEQRVEPSVYSSTGEFAPVRRGK